MHNDFLKYGYNIKEISNITILYGDKLLGSNMEWWAIKIMACFCSTLL